LRRNPNCPVCGDHPTISELIDYEAFCGVPSAAETEGLREREITAEELKEKIDRREEFFLLDVREPHEYEIANLGGKLIPLNDLPQRVHELDSSNEIIVYCASGIRSAKAVKFLNDIGFRKVKNLVGGISGWAERIDHSLASY
ncbi:MAG TPA: rhodanese-like domain-containing protein, partial [Bacteroidota bacterium]|nr:rhodanese-like domain-containing protein [Bacteroidota bacterium]